MGNVQRRLSSIGVNEERANSLDRFTKPTGLYDSCAWDERVVRKHILDGKLAPRVQGSDSKDHPGFEECPICFMFYSRVNRSTCCNQAVCTECFLQIRPPRKLVDCPFCNTSGFQAKYKGDTSLPPLESPEKDAQSPRSTSKGRVAATPPKPIPANRARGRSEGDIRGAGGGGGGNTVMSSARDRRRLEEQVRRQHAYSAPHPRSMPVGGGGGSGGGSGGGIGSRGSSRHSLHNSSGEGSERRLWPGDRDDLPSRSRAHSSSSYHERRRRGRRSNQTGAGSELDSIEAMLDHFGSPGDLRQMEDLMIMQAIRLSMLEAEANEHANTPAGTGGATAPAAAAAAATAIAAATTTTTTVTPATPSHDDVQTDHPLALPSDAPVAGGGGDEGGAGQSVAAAAVVTTNPAPHSTELPAGQAANSSTTEGSGWVHAPEAAFPASALRSLLSDAPDTAEAAMLLDEERQLRLAISLSLQDSAPGDELDAADAPDQATATGPPLSQAGSSGGQDEPELESASGARSPSSASDQSTPSADRRDANSASPADSLGAASNGSEDMDVLGAFKFEQHPASAPAEVEVELQAAPQPAPPVEPGVALRSAAEGQAAEEHAALKLIDMSEPSASFEVSSAAAAALETCDEPATEDDLLPQVEAGAATAPPSRDATTQGDDAASPLGP